MTPLSDAGASVNEHYLEHVVTTAATHGVEAGEDIIAGNGMKLLAKGAKVDPSVRERLLQHKLSKPLEQCLVVTDALQPARLAEVAERLLEQHPFLGSVCAPGRAQSVPAVLARVALSVPAQSLLSVHAGQTSDRLDHVVTVCLIAVGVGRRVLAGDIDRHRVLMLAGLLHDVGELYLDPALLTADAKLGPEQWKHIVTHPLVGERVLSGLDGVGRPVSTAVAQHHERLDGFGYPRGTAGEALAMTGQILAAAEWTAGLIRSARGPFTSGAVATKLMPGDFPQAVVTALTGAAESERLAPAPHSVERTVLRMARIGTTVQRFADSQAYIEDLLATSSPALRRLLESSTHRMARISRALSSTGLAPDKVEQLYTQAVATHDVRLQAEISAIVSELGWRLRELERDSLLHSGMLSPDEDRSMRQLIARLTGRSL